MTSISSASVTPESGGGGGGGTADGGGDADAEGAGELPAGEAGALPESGGASVFVPHDVIKAKQNTRQMIRDIALLTFFIFTSPVIKIYYGMQKNYT